MIGILTNTGKFSIFKIGDLQIKFKIVEVFQKILDLKQDDCQI